VLNRKDLRQPLVVLIKIQLWRLRTGVAGGVPKSGFLDVAPLSKRPHRQWVKYRRSNGVSTSL
jgi:hypothetical protein